MEETISAADANRRFSALIRGVRAGQSYVVTSHGRPVARIAPAADGDRVQARARESLFARLAGQQACRAEPWTRDELYDEA